MRVGRDTRANAARLITALSLFLASGAAFFFARRDPEGVRRVFSPFSRAACGHLARVFSVFPFSAAELLLYLLVLSAAGYSVYTAVLLVRRDARLNRLIRFLVNTILSTCVALFLFTFLWGLNYMAPSVSGTLGLSVSPRPASQLFETARFLRDRLNACAPLVSRDAQGVSSFGSFSSLSRRAGDGYPALAARYPVFSGGLSAPKPVAAWPLMSYAGISGIYTPFTGEANVNPTTPQACLPFTMAHELAHRLGVAPEDEANFAAFLSCVRHPDSAFVYSGYFEAFLSCYNAVFEIDEAQQSLLWQTLDARVQADIHALVIYNQAYAGRAREAGTRLNDSYLKVFAQDDGVRSYGRVTDLLIAWYMDGHAQTDARLAE